MSSSHEYQVFADYFQFLLEDEGVDQTDLPAWDEATVEQLLLVLPGRVLVGTARNMTVPVEVEILAQPPALDTSPWDKINECSLEIKSGRLVILGNDYYPEAPRLNMSPGLYHVRLHYGGLATLSEDGMDGNDHYHIQLWPTSRVIPPTIIK